MAVAERAPLPPDDDTRLRLRSTRRVYEAWAATRITDLPATADPSSQINELEAQVCALQAQVADLDPEDAGDLPAIVVGLGVDLASVVDDPLGPAAEAMEPIAEYFGATERADSPLGLRKRVRAAGRVLQDPVRGHDPAALEELIGELTEMADVAAKQGMNRDLVTMWWCLQVCLRRRGQQHNAADIMQRLWGGAGEDPSRDP